MPAPEIERWCEIVAATKVRSTNKKRRHLSTVGTLQLLVERRAPRARSSAVRLPTRSRRRKFGRSEGALAPPGAARLRRRRRGEGSGQPGSTPLSRQAMAIETLSDAAQRLEQALARHRKARALNEHRNSWVRDRRPDCRSPKLSDDDRAFIDAKNGPGRGTNDANRIRRRITAREQRQSAQNAAGWHRSGNTPPPFELRPPRVLCGAISRREAPIPCVQSADKQECWRERVIAWLRISS